MCVNGFDLKVFSTKQRWTMRCLLILQLAFIFFPSINKANTLTTTGVIFVFFVCISRQPKQHKACKCTFVRHRFWATCLNYKSWQRAKRCIACISSRPPSEARSLLGEWPSCKTHITSAVYASTWITGRPRRRINHLDFSGWGGRSHLCSVQGELLATYLGQAGKGLSGEDELEVLKLTSRGLSAPQRATRTQLGRRIGPSLCPLQIITCHILTFCRDRGRVPGACLPLLQILEIRANLLTWNSTPKFFSCTHESCRYHCPDAQVGR